MVASEVLCGADKSTHQSSSPLSTLNRIRLLFASTENRACSLLSRLLHGLRGYRAFSSCTGRDPLYEAAVEAMEAFRHSALADVPIAPATQLPIRVVTQEEEHTLSIARVLSWLEGNGRRPSEQVKKNRLRERLRR